MAYFTSSRSRWSYYRRPRTSRRYSRGLRRRATGNSRAARQQRDSAVVTISRIASSSVVVGSSGGNAAIAINHFDQLRQSQYFPNYSPMYDQFKLDKVRMKITGSQLGSSTAANVSISPAVVLAFDRNGLNEGQELSSAVVSTYSSAQLKNWSTGNAFVMYQTIYPSTIMEKGQYLPTDSLESPTDNTESTNPCVNTSSSTLPFKPITLLAVDLGGTSFEAQQTFAFTIEYEYTVTFRGMRKPTIG